MTRLSLDLIKQLCTDASFERGKRYLQEGRVKIREASPPWIKAVVAGTRNYRVEINLEDKKGLKGISATCTCPYDLEGYCKHIVATLLSILEDEAEIESMVKTSSKRQKSMYEMLEEADAEVLREFLRQEMERLPEMQERFMACFSVGGEGRSLKHYKGEVESLYEEAEDHGFVHYGEDIDFDTLKDLAEIYIQKGDFLEGAKIYQALFEVIAEKMDNVDDSDGYYGSEFSRCLMAFVECIDNARLTAEAKRKYIDYLFGKYLENDPDYFRDDYDEALRDLCTTEEDLRHWKEMLERHMREKGIPEKTPDEKKDWSGYCRARALISMHLYVLSKLKSAEEFYSQMERQYRSSHDLCLMYAKRLQEDGNRDKAVEVAEECLGIFPDYASKGLKEFLSEIYRETDPAKYRHNLQSLFLLTKEWKYYEQLKIVSQPEEWKEHLEKILAYFSLENRDGYRIADIYLREQMYDDALQKVLAMKSLFALSQYRKELAPRYPDQYFDGYRELIMPFAGEETGRKHYHKVVSYLKEMKSIGGHEEEVREIVGRLREKHRRQPAFIDELKGL